MIERETRWVRRFVGQGYEPMVLQQRERVVCLENNLTEYHGPWSEWMDVPVVEDK